MSLEQARQAIGRARVQLAKVQLEADDFVDPDPESAVMWAFYTRKLRQSAC